MSAATLVRQRKRRREEGMRYARAYLAVERLPRGVPAVVHAWAAGLTDDEVRWGAPAQSLAAELQPYRKKWVGL